MIFALLSTLLFAPMANAAGPARPLAPQGFTQDGQYLLYRDWLDLLEKSKSDEEDDGEPRNVDCTASIAVVRELSTQHEDRYLFALEGKQCKRQTKAAALAQLKSKADLDAFLQSHPVAAGDVPKPPLAAALIALHATDCAAFQCKAGICTSTLEFERCKHPDEQNDLATEGGLDLALKRTDGKVYLLHHVRVFRGMEASHIEESSTVSWAPDGNRVAVVSVSTSWVVAKVQSHEVTIELVSFDQTRVSVLGYLDPDAKRDEHQSRLQSPLDSRDVAAAVAEAVRKLGAYHVSIGETRSPRTETVVYPAKGFEADAARIGAAIPGAKVEPLTWNGDADIVVACVAK